MRPVRPQTKKEIAAATPNPTGSRDLRVLRKTKMYGMEIIAIPSIKPLVLEGSYVQNLNNAIQQEIRTI